MTAAGGVAIGVYVVLWGGCLVAATYEVGRLVWAELTNPWKGR